MKHRFLVNLTLCGVIEQDDHGQTLEDSMSGLEFILTENSNPGLLLGMLLSQMDKRAPGKGNFGNWGEQEHFARFKIALATDEQVEELGGVCGFDCGTDVAINNEAYSDCACGDCPWSPLGTGF